MSSANSSGSDKDASSKPTPKSTKGKQAAKSTAGTVTPLTDKVALVDDIIVCAAHRQSKCEACDVDFNDQNLMTKNLAANKGRLPPPHPQMGKAIQSLKAEGNTAFRNKDHRMAMAKYTEALNISRQRPVWDPAALIVEELSVLLCNRAACELEVDAFSAAYYDAEIVTRIKHTWSKGHFRRGRALFGQKKYRAAQQSFELGCALDTEATEMKSFLVKTQALV
ncbi:hypothetical protein H4R34_003447 [Dimargaris verticillata]|uniref:Translocation protein sec72 n=1 Tax=Dimargaris verticillata TaxID=2761393 RepID=A0A9W8B0U3_9FUNG|nr:hypothetical protein H4R34_003447 [Dimargaris verticillata]